MTRDLPRAFLFGFLTAAVLAIGAFLMHDGAVSAAIAQQDRTSDSLTTLLLASERKARESQARQLDANRIADQQSARAEALANRLGQIVAGITVRPSLTPSAPGDTVAYAVVLRPNDTTGYRVPAFLVEDRDAMLALVVQFKFSWESERTARLQYVNETVPDLTRQLRDADAVIGSLREGIALRDARRSPRCGMKCGAVIGAGVTVAAAIGLQKVGAVLR